MARLKTAIKPGGKASATIAEAPAPGLIHVSFWGRCWQTDPAAKARAASVLARMNGKVLQASYYIDEGWYDGMRPSAMQLEFVRRTIQLLITRGAVGEIHAPSDPRVAPLLVFLDDSLSLSDAVDGPNSAYHAHFRTMLGGECLYGVLPWATPEADVERLLQAVVATPTSRGPRTNCRTTISRATEPAPGRSELRLPRLPAITVAERAPGFRIKADEVNRYFADLGWPPSQAAAMALRRVAGLIEKKVVRRATRPTPATESELTDFHGPNPRITFAERLISLKHYLRRPSHPQALMVEDILAGIDEASFARMRVDYFGSGAFGFVDTVFWIYHKLLLAKTLGLVEGPPRSILDVGCGGGHFGRVCQHFGHAVIGTDIENPVYHDIAAALGANRTIERLEALTPMPDFGQKFDLVVACQIEFDRHFSDGGAPAYWSLDEWKFLFNDLFSRQLRFPARIYITLNYEVHQGRGVFNEALLRYCARRGADVNEKRGIIDWTLKAPVRLD